MLPADQAPSQLQRSLQAHRFGVTQTTDPRQLRHVQAKESAQPAVMRQQPLRDIGDRFAPDAGLGNRYDAIMQSCCGSRRTM
jgi:hypothetical protein